MSKLIIKIIPMLLLSLVLTNGCSLKGKVENSGDGKSTTATTEKKEKTVLKGKIINKSGRSKTISIFAGKGDTAKTVLIAFNDSTQGLIHAIKNHAVIISYKVVGKNKVATLIQPKLAKLPAGVLEIQPKDLVKMRKNNERFILVDARPAKRFHAGTIPGSISISVPMMKKMGETLLPADKNIPLVFYCGGVT